MWEVFFTSHPLQGSGRHGHGAAYWLPNPFWAPQSGHCQVMPLQDIPHTFSCMQSWQIQKPQRQHQQKGTVAPQQWQRVRSKRCFFKR
jgi:hypothetical protein